MTAPTRPQPPSGDVRRWPTDPRQLIDTTLCPACFSRLGGTRCGVCGLELAVPAASDLLAASTRAYDAELDRQRLITRMRADQAAAAAASVRTDAAALAPQPPAPAPAPALTHVPAPAATSAAPPLAAIPAVVASPPGPVPTIAPFAAPVGPEAAGEEPAARRSGRSGVQVLLLTLGVVLLSIAAIVFLFVAYLFASLQVRSIVIAAASILVLGTAWLLRARRLPGTAEGVAAVAVVLLVLDVWIVRENDLFGSDGLRASTYWGGALLVVAALLAATRAVSGVRVPGFAAAALAPVAAFLLGFGIAPETPSEFGTGLWLGSLAASVAGSAALLMKPRAESTIVAIAGYVAGGLALVSAFFALPDLEWSALWTYAGVAVAWLLALAALRVARDGRPRVWSVVAAIALGVSASLAPALAVAIELDPGDGLWLAPAGATAVACIAAAVTRIPGRTAREARPAFAASAIVAGLAAGPGLVLGAASIVSALAAASPWSLEGDERILPADSEFDLAVVLAPAVVAAGSTLALVLLGRIRLLAAIPIGAALFTVVVAATVAPTLGLTVGALLLVAGGSLGLAVPGWTRVAAGLLPTLAALGIGSAVMTWVLGHASTEVWWWASLGVLVLAVAGRVVASRVWPLGAALLVGALHLGVAAVLAVIALATVPWWAAESARPFAPPWDAPSIWVGVVATVVLAAFAVAERMARLDRGVLVAPLLLAALGSVVTLALAPTSSFAWLPAALLAAAGPLWMRASAPPELRIAFAATTPLAVGIAAALVVLELDDRGRAALGLAGAALACAALAHVLVRRSERGVVVSWSSSVGLVAILSLATASSSEPWLVLMLLTPVPVVLAALDGDPIGGDAPTRHLSWLSLPLAVGSVWTWLAGDAVTDVEAYSLPLAAILGIAGGLITWRRTAPDGAAAGRTALFASAAAVAVLPSVAASADSELRTLVLSGTGVVVVLAGLFLPGRARGVPLRLLAVGAGWTAVTGAAFVRGSAIAGGASSSLLPEFWPILAVATGILAAVGWVRTGSRPAAFAEWLVAASVVLASVPTLVAITVDDHASLRAAVLFPVLAVVHVASVAVRTRPFEGPILGWSSLGALVVGGAVALATSAVDPFELVTAAIGLALVAAGAVRMRRTPGVRSWPALGPGLAVLLVPSLVADYVDPDPDLWRIVALGVVAVAAVVVGATLRLQAPLLLGGAVLLLHAIAQLWPWITRLYESVPWWLWLAIAGALLIVLAATYERQLRLARGAVRSIGALR